MKRIILFFILFLISIPNVNANCSDEEVIRLSKIANNVTISYIYNEQTKRFDVTFTNLTKELIITNKTNGKMYNEDIELTIENLTSGNYKFNISASDSSCNLGTLQTKFVNLPYYNKYFYREECEGIKEYSYCTKWVKNKVSDEIYEKKIEEYRKSLVKEEQETEEVKISLLDEIKNIFIDLYVNYYYIILPLIITMLCIIIYLKDKSDQII